jgi:hypothetical protein
MMRLDKLYLPISFFSSNNFISPLSFLFFSDTSSAGRGAGGGGSVSRSAGGENGWQPLAAGAAGARRQLQLRHREHRRRPVGTVATEARNEHHLADCHHRRQRLPHRKPRLRVRRPPTLSSFHSLLLVLSPSLELCGLIPDKKKFS